MIQEKNSKDFFSSKDIKFKLYFFYKFLIILVRNSLADLLRNPKREKNLRKIIKGAMSIALSKTFGK